MPRRCSLLQVLLLWAVAGASHGVAAQTVVDADERLATDRPEAWAMNYYTATSFMTGFGETPALRPGQWAAAIEGGHIPRLSDEQRQVGFIGSKQEDLNRSPVIGRLRVLLGLADGWVAELGWTPPLELDDARARDLVAVAFGRRLLERGDFSLSARVFGQHGSVSGDITCPADVAAIPPGPGNTYGCRAPSDDRLQLNYYGIELTPVLRRGAWQWHASVAAVRTETEVQVDAFVFAVHDRTRLTAKDVLPAIAFGTSRGVGQRWRWGAELLYVPLEVQRDGGDAENDPLTSVRLYLRYQSP